MAEASSVLWEHRRGSPSPASRTDEVACELQLGWDVVVPRQRYGAVPGKEKRRPEDWMAGDGEAVPQSYAKQQHRVHLTLLRPAWVPEGCGKWRPFGLG